MRIQIDDPTTFATRAEADRYALLLNNSRENATFRFKGGRSTSDRFLVEVIEHSGQIIGFVKIQLIFDPQED